LGVKEKGAGKQVNGIWSFQMVTAYSLRIHGPFQAAG